MPAWAVLFQALVQLVHRGLPALGSEAELARLYRPKREATVIHALYFWTEVARAKRKFMREGVLPAVPVEGQTIAVDGFEFVVQTVKMADCTPNIVVVFKSDQDAETSALMVSDLVQEGWELLEHTINAEVTLHAVACAHCRDKRPVRVVRRRART